MRRQRRRSAGLSTRSRVSDSEREDNERDPDAVCWVELGWALATDQVCEMYEFM